MYGPFLHMYCVLAVLFRTLEYFDIELYIQARRTNSKQTLSVGESSGREFMESDSAKLDILKACWNGVLPA